MVHTMVNEMTQSEILHGDQCWQAVMARDQQADGTFVFAVQSTGIYCRPSCPARRPRRENVRFFRYTAEAVQAGFRPCLRCHPDQETHEDPQAELVAQVCRYITTHLDASLQLADLSAQFHVSPYHLQRIFKRVTGISPRQYTESCRLGQFKERLQDGEGVTGALYNAGYQSSSRVYDRAATQLGMTPLMYRQRGKGMRLAYTVVPYAMGYVLLAATDRGIADVRLGDNEAILVAGFSDEYASAEIVRDDQGLQAWTTLLLQLVQGQEVTSAVPLDVQASAFQWRVWEALRAIPRGETRSYQEIAQAIGQPSAARAVAHACATNQVALFIPCHRVVRSDGSAGGYRWGKERKQQLLAGERAVATAQPMGNQEPG